MTTSQGRTKGCEWLGPLLVGLITLTTQDVCAGQAFASFDKATPHDLVGFAGDGTPGVLLHLAARNDDAPAGGEGDVASPADPTGDAPVPDGGDQDDPAIPDLSSDPEGGDTGSDDGDVDTSVRDLFHVGFQGTDTSDPFQDSKTYLSYRNHRRDFLWPWEESSSRTPDGGISAEVHEGKTDSQNYRSWRFAGLIGKKILTNSYVEAAAGVHHLHVNQTDKTTVFYPFRVTGIFGLSHGLNVQYETKQDFVYSELFIPAGISKALWSTYHTLSTDWQPESRVRLNLTGAYRDISDSNTERHADFSAMYGISPEWPWIWLGIGGENLSYDAQTTDYWSPSKFTSLGLRLDSSFPMARKITGNLAVNLSRIEEDDTAVGTGEYYAAGLDYKLSPTLYLRLNLTHIRSLQRGSAWTENDYGLTLSGALF